MSLVEILILIVVIAWLLGYTLVGSSLFHLLIIVLIVLLIVRVIQGRKVV